MSRINLDYLNSLCGGDSEFLSSMLATYIEETGQDFNLLEKAYDEKNFERIGFYAHKIKASFQLLGLKDLAVKTEILEKKSKSGIDDISEITKEYLFIKDKISDTFLEAKSLIENL